MTFPAGIQHLSEASKSVALPEIPEGVGEINVLRERAIYRTPQGLRLVASRERRSDYYDPQLLGGANVGEGYLLYSSYAWAFHGPADYVVTETEVVPLKPKSIFLSADELIDTGWTAGDH